MTQDSWGTGAQAFYNQKAASKRSARHYETFVQAYRKILSRLPSLRQSAVLDLGCGPGFLTQALSSEAKFIAGVDIALENLNLAREKNPLDAFAAADMTSLPLKTAAFEAAVALSSLEFCADKRAALKELKRILKPGGIFYFEVRNRDFILFSCPDWLHRGLLKAKFLRPYPVPGFQDLPYKKWRKLVEEAGFVVERAYPSLRPWNYGNFSDRLKNLLIEAAKKLFPLRKHYMIGFCCRKP